MPRYNGMAWDKRYPWDDKRFNQSGGPAPTWTANNEIISTQDAYRIHGWRFSEGELLVDSVGSNTLTNNGTVTNTATGKRGYEATFSGTTQYLTGTPPVFGSDNFFISQWVKVGTDSANNWIFAMVVDGSNYWELFMGDANQGLKFRIRVVGTFEVNCLEGSQSLVVGTPAHVAMGRTGSTFKLYVNGATVASDTYASALASFSNMWIGGRSTGPNYYNGSEDEIEMWQAHTLNTTDMLAFAGALYNDNVGAFSR